MDRREFLTTCIRSVAGLGALHLFPRNSSLEAQTVKRGFLGVRSSPWFKDLGRQRLECTLCPQACMLSPGQRGRCRVRENRAGSGVSLTYGTPCLAQIEPVERIPFYHVFPGSRTLTVATAGCPLECAFCEVWDMALVRPEDIHVYDMPPLELVRFAQSTKAESISYALGEPTAFFEYMLDTAILARKSKLLNLMHTSAYISPSALKVLLPYLDAVNIDLKSIDPAFYRTYTGVDPAPIFENVRLLVRSGVHVELTHLVVPTLNDDPASLQRLAQWIKQELGTKVPIHFARFYPLYKLTNLPPTPVSALDRAHTIARNTGLEYVYIARVTGHRAESSFCPHCGKTIIPRVGFIVERIHVRNGACAFCNHPIPGRWMA